MFLVFLDSPCGPIEINHVLCMSFAEWADIERFVDGACDRIKEEVQSNHGCIIVCVGEFFQLCNVRFSSTFVLS